MKIKHFSYNYFKKSSVARGLSTKTSPSFDAFYSSLAKGAKYIDPNWLKWFIGFTEGDGGLHLYNKNFIFGLTQKEEDVLQEVKAILGFGKVYFDISVNAYRYRVTKKSDIFKLAILFNGNLATKNKIDQLGTWINTLNSGHENIIFNPIPFKPTLQDSWLSGFTAAEGSFIAGVVNQKSKKEVIDSEGNMGVKETTSQLVRIRFVLDQKDEPLLLHIKNLFGVGSVQKTSDPGVFRYSIVSFKSNSFIVEYFSAFYLKGKKQSAFSP